MRLLTAGSLVRAQQGEPKERLTHKREPFFFFVQTTTDYVGGAEKALVLKRNKKLLLVFLASGNKSEMDAKKPVRMIPTGFQYNYPYYNYLYCK